MANLAIIPARGGSKRIPRKNIKNFLGKPIIAYSIQAALESNLFDEVMVSTDDNEIAEVALKYGAKVPFFRSKKNSDDFATTVDVLVEVIEKYQEEGREFNTTCCIYPTAPFVTSTKLKQAFDKLNDSKFDCVFPVVRYGYPVQRALFLEETSDKIKMMYPENLNSRSQDLKPSFHDSGQFYFFDNQSFSETGKLWTNNTGCIEVSEIESQDIDNEVDWKIAELKYRLNNGI